VFPSLVQHDYGLIVVVIVAYFTQATVDYLGTIDDIPNVGDLKVPPDLFITRAPESKTPKIRKGGRPRGRTRDGNSTPSTVTRRYASYPAPTGSSPQSDMIVVPQLRSYAPYQQHGVEYGQAPFHHVSHVPADHAPNLDPLSPFSNTRIGLVHQLEEVYSPPHADTCHHSLSLEHSNESHPFHQTFGVESGRQYYDSPTSVSSCSSPVHYSEDSPGYFRPTSTTMELSFDTTSPRHPSSPPRQSYTERQSNVRAEIQVPANQSSYFPPLTTEGHNGSSQALGTFSRVPFYDAIPREAEGYYDETREGLAAHHCVGLAPLQVIQRPHPSKRDPLDDRALRSLRPSKS
jgi:hypothetical protein